MKNIILIMVLFCTTLQAQKLKLDFGMSGGVSILQHNTNFRVTALGNLYETVKISFPGQDYTWQQFTEDYDIRQYIIAPRYGISGSLSWNNIPVYGRFDLQSSTSSIKKLSTAATIGFRYVSRDEFDLKNWYWRIAIGFKHVFKDQGFGRETMINSIGNENARYFVESFFGKKLTLGKQSGNLVRFEFTVGRFFDRGHNTSLSVELYQEIDMTAGYERVGGAMMSNAGASLIFNFKNTKR